MLSDDHHQTVARIRCSRGDQRRRAAGECAPRARPDRAHIGRRRHHRRHRRHDDARLRAPRRHRAGARRSHRRRRTVGARHDPARRAAHRRTREVRDPRPRRHARAPLCRRMGRRLHRRRTSSPSMLAQRHDHRAADDRHRRRIGACGGASSAARLLGPQLWIASPQVERRLVREHATSCRSPDDARRAVRMAADSGLRLREADDEHPAGGVRRDRGRSGAAGIRVVGHVDPRVGVRTGAAREAADRAPRQLHGVRARRLRAVARESCRDVGAYRARQLGDARLRGRPQGRRDRRSDGARRRVRHADDGVLQSLVRHAADRRRDRARAPTTPTSRRACATLYERARTRYWKQPAVGRAARAVHRGAEPDGARDRGFRRRR